MIRQSILLFQCRGIIFMYVIIQTVRVVQYLLLIMQPFETKISPLKVIQTTLNACKRVMDPHYKTK